MNGGLGKAVVDENGLEVCHFVRGVKWVNVHINIMKALELIVKKQREFRGETFLPTPYTNLIPIPVYNYWDGPLK